MLKRLFSICLVLVLLLSFSAAFQLQQVFANGSWLSGWSYRKSHLIYNATGAGTGYQVRVKVHYDAITSTPLDEFDKYVNNPILVKGANGEWDDAALDTMTVPIWNPEDEQWYIYYEGYDGLVWCIGLARSSDGLSWTKYEGNPVLDIGAVNENTGCCDPDVMRIDSNTWKMFYVYTTVAAGEWKCGLATSSDGIAWTPYASNPVFQIGGGVYTPFIIDKDPDLWLYYQNSDNIRYAISDDGGYSWADQGILLDLADNLVGLTLTERNSIWYMFYGRNIGNGGKLEIWRCQSEDGLTNWANHIKIMGGDQGTWEIFLALDGHILHMGNDDYYLYYAAGTESGGFNFQIGVAINRKLFVSCEGHCRTDFGDLRWTDDDGLTQLSFYMEKQVVSDYADFWVKVDDDLSSQNVTIFMYYGKSDATTTSSGSATFPTMFLDFENYNLGDINGQDGWTAGSAFDIQTTTYYEGTKAVQHTSSVQTAQKNYGTQSNLRIVWYWAKSVTNVNYPQICMRTQAGTYLSLTILKNNGFIQYHDGANWWSLAPYVANTWARVEGVFRTSDDSAKWKVGDGGFCGWDDQYGAWTDNIGQLYISADTGSNTWFDLMFIGKFVDPEPTHAAWGSEENALTCSVTAQSVSYAHTYSFINLTVSSYQVSNFENATVELNQTVILIFVNATNTFSKSDASNYAVLDSLSSIKTDLNATAIEISWYLYFRWNYSRGYLTANVSLFCGSQTLSNLIFPEITFFEDQLEIHSSEIDDPDRVNPAQNLTFTSQLFYNDTSIVPEVREDITVCIELSGSLQAETSSINSSGYSQASCLAQTSVALYHYNVYGLTDETTAKNQTVDVIVDRVNITWSVDDDDVWNGTTVNFTLLFHSEYDQAEITNPIFTVQRNITSWLIDQTTNFTDQNDTAWTLYEYSIVSVDNTWNLNNFTLVPASLSVLWYGYGAAAPPSAPVSSGGMLLIGMSCGLIFALVFVGVVVRKSRKEEEANEQVFYILSYRIRKVR